MRVLVCGSREWADHVAVCYLLNGVYAGAMGGMTVIDGGAPGADDSASRWAEGMMGWEENPAADDVPIDREQYPADWEKHGKAAGPIRNALMLEEGKPDLVLAFKDGFDWQFKRGGTEHMVRIAKAAGVRTIVIQHA